jgi:hypothetical protein
MTPEQRARRTEWIKADRVARGLPESIESPIVYRILDAVLARQAERKPVPPARYSTKPVKD